MGRFQVSFWANDLSHGGCFAGKPDCYAVLEDKAGAEIGRTETIVADSQPDWVKILFIEADAAQFTPLTVKVYHETTYDPILLGHAVFEATEVHQATGHTESKALQEGKSKGQISMSVVESDGSGERGLVTLQIRGLDIFNSEPGALGLGRSDPFFEIAKKTKEPLKGFSRWNAVYRSEIVEDHLNPFWKEFTIGLEELCNGNTKEPIRIAVFDARKGANRLIGAKETTLEQIEQRVGIRGNADREMAFEMVYESETGKTTGTGLLCILKCVVDKAA